MTQDDLDTLERALAKGERRVTFSDGSSAEFNSFDELVKRIQYVRLSLGQSNAERKLLVQVTKGVQC